jgi:hypothetical protein
MRDCEYTPQIIGGDMPQTLPTVTPVDYVRFTYPFVSPTFTLQCKTPELGNNHTYTAMRLMRETRGKTFHTIRYAMWPKVDVMNINFMNLDQTAANNFKSLITMSVGKYIGYLDYLSRQWKCLITNPDTAISQEAVNCGYAVQLQMEVTAQ